MPSLSDAERKAILELARRAVVEAVGNLHRTKPIPNEGIFAMPCGVFVSLHVDGRLRGCIGVVEPREGLGESIVRCAAGAALEDPRFAHMRPEEAARAEIEVSLLSAMRPIRPEEIEIGTHGLLIERDGRRGLLLPQVAVEHHLGREEFLRETCVKAGLPPRSWEAEGTSLLGFTCQIVKEQN